MSQKIEVNGHGLTIEKVNAVARHHGEVEVGLKAFAGIAHFREGLEQAITRGDVMYGVNTGCGSRKNQILTLIAMAFRP